MAANLAEKLKKIKEDLKTPPKLSDVEREKITATFEAMKDVLDDTLEIVLEKDRAEAFRYTNLLVTSIQQADALFIGDVASNGLISGENGINENISREDGRTPATKKLPVKKPSWASFAEKLTERQREIGNRYLDCFQMYPDVGDEIVCNDCSLEKMIACIRTADPSIDPNEDFKLDLEMMKEK